MKNLKVNLVTAIGTVIMFSFLFLVIGYNWAIKAAKPIGYVNDHTEFIIEWYGEQMYYDVTE